MLSTAFTEEPTGERGPRYEPRKAILVSLYTFKIIHFVGADIIEVSALLLFAAADSEEDEEDPPACCLLLFLVLLFVCSSLLSPGAGFMKMTFTTPENNRYAYQRIPLSAVFLYMI